MEENTNIEVVNDSGDMLLSSSGRATFCSMNPKTQKEKIEFYNAISSPEKKLVDMINMEIKIKHVYAEECTYIDKRTGEESPGVRIVIIDDTGKSYSTSSIGIYNSLTRIFKIFGFPQTWKEAMKVRVKQITPSDDKRVITLELVQ